MTTTHPAGRWSLARVLVLVLAGAFAGLMVDIRVEHVDVVRETWVAWTPIVYSAVMLLACVTAVVLWNDSVRKVMLALFLAAFVVGGVGFYFHNKGKLGAVATSALDAWVDPKMKHMRGPPQMAPLAFGGLGLLGVLGSMKRFG